MKEYIVTEHHDFPYEEPKPQELIRCKECDRNPYNKPACVDVVHGTPERCWDLASRKGAFCSEGKRRMTQEELIRKFGKETVERYLSSCNEDYACGNGDCIFYKEDGCLWHDAERKEE